MSKFEVYKDAAGKFRFRLRGRNNRIVAVGEAYERRASCVRGIKSVQKNCSAEIEDLTIKGRKVPNPKYQIYKDAAGKFRFRLKAPNGEIIAEGEAYETKETCLNGIEVVRSSSDAKIEDLSAAEKVSEEPAPSKTEEIAAPTKVEIEAKTEAALPEVKTEELPPTTPAPTVEMEIPKIIGPVETKLELYNPPENITKGDVVALQGRLFASDTGKGIAGAKIHIYERDTSILGDDYLAYGTTKEDGSFNIHWKARSLTWRKNTGNIYARFEGNKEAKPSKSNAQSIIIK
ncbi:MAG: YegP family protein [Candidatus Bathycorpusculaceae bacterium]